MDDCKILGAPPGSETIVQRALYPRRYSRATLQGKPLAVEYSVK
jgi:hypothetical protein